MESRFTFTSLCTNIYESKYCTSVDNKKGVFFVNGDKINMMASTMSFQTHFLFTNIVRNVNFILLYIEIRISFSIELYYICGSYISNVEKKN